MKTIKKSLKGSIKNGSSCTTTLYETMERYIDDKILIIKIGSIDCLLSILNSFGPNIQFTYELEQSSIFR